MFLWNNIFFSLGFDVKEHYKDFGGDYAAYVAPVSHLGAKLGVRGKARRKGQLVRQMGVEIDEEGDYKTALFMDSVPAKEG